MKKLFFITALFLAGAIHAQVTFQKTFGGTGDDWSYSVQQTTDGGYIIAGQTTSFVTGGAWLIKTDANGDTLWSKNYGGIQGEGASSVQQTSDGGYIFSGYSYSFGPGGSSLYLVKTNAAGDTLWTKAYGGIANEWGGSVQQTIDGGYLIAGETNSYGAGSNDAYLIKTDANGDTLWTKTYGGAGDESNVAAQQTSDGGYVLASRTNSFGAGAYDVYVVKTDASGNTIWAKTYGGTSDEWGYSVQQTTDGGYIISASTYSFGAGMHDAYLIKTDASGDTSWTKTYGGVSDEVIGTAQQTSDGGYIITTRTFSFGGGFYDTYLVKTDANGDTLWTKTYGGTDDEWGRSVQQTTDGGYIISGTTYSFGAGSSDFYLIKTDSLGNSGGCYEYPAATIVGNTATITGSGGVVGSGGIVQNTATIVSNTATVDSLLCFNPNCNIALTVSANDATCGINNGSATVTLVQYATPPFSYQWSSGDTLPTADSLFAGMYTVTVTDSLGCSSFAIATVNDQNGPSIAVNNNTPVSCFGDYNGAIDISVSGGTPQYTYLWSNGQTTEDVTGLPAGTHEISVTDANGCIAVQSISVTGPAAPLSLPVSTVSATCGNNDGSATVNPSGGAVPYTYNWSTGGTNQTEVNLAAGVYAVTVTDINGCIDSAFAAVSNTGSLTITIDAIIDGTCNGGGSVNITASGGTPPYTYLWSNGATVDDITGLASGTYNITVTDNGGCIATATIVVQGIIPADVEICLVTVDTTTGTNMVVWEKTTGQGIASFNIYKESTTAGLYYLIGNVPFDSLSIYIDSVSNPQIRSWRYKISAVDSCDEESGKSAPHKTIHLVLSQFGNNNYLIWDNYEGFNFGTFYIWRYSTQWDLIDSLPSNLFSYMDLLPPNGNLDYVIEARHPSSCSPTRASYNSSRSNKSDNIGNVGINENGLSSAYLRVYPNPAKDEFTISGNYELPAVIELYDITGRKVIQLAINKTQFTIDVSELAKGMYVWQLDEARPACAKPELRFGIGRGKVVVE